MSRNLLIKQMFATVDPEKKRVIDTNTLMEKRMEEHAEKRKYEAGDGFAAGLVAETIEMPIGEDGEPAATGNVIKAGEEVAEILEQAGQQAEELVANARLEAEKILADARAEAESERQRLFEEAEQQGYAEGQRRMENEAENLRRQFAEKEKVLEDNYEEQLQDMEPRIVEAITDIYEHIFHTELSSYREILVYLISNTLRRQEGGNTFVIHVSKDDYPYVNMQKKQMLTGAAAANSNVDVVEDLTLSKNDCMIETAGGIFDCGLGTQLAELKQKLMLLAWSKEE